MSSLSGESLTRARRGGSTSAATIGTDVSKLDLFLSVRLAWFQLRKDEVRLGSSF